MSKQIERDYKIETKPTLWEVTLESGAYSDWSLENYFIRANDRDEAWYLFKRYWETEEPAKDNDRRYNLVLWDNEYRTLEEFQVKTPDPEYPSREFDTDYGRAYGVHIHQLNVIEFKR